MQKDLCVVLMTSYNHEKYIRESIESVINQTYKNLKLVIVDDFSTDDSRKIIKEYAAKYPNKIFYIFNEINMHVNRSFNRGLEFIKEKFDPEFFACIASDDIFEKDKIEKQIDFLKKYDLDGVSSKGKYINEKSKILAPIEMDNLFNKNLYAIEDIEKIKNFYYMDIVGGPLIQSMVFKFPVIYRLKMDLTSISDDYSLMLRFFNNGYKLGYLNEFLWRYRRHDTNVSKNYDYIFVVLDVIYKYIPKKYRNVAIFKQFFITGIYKIFIHDQKADGIRFIWMSLAYLNLDGIKFIGKKFFGGIKFILRSKK
ncbi:glycosyltransferase [Hippea sp. KM1]|uniref:glycosyltransferase n=1 Tax=Hippea sp. KM1 TaxID=944481 RepID=UPI00046CA67D|nr:glycosyltransferase [Hippea sp. KM1]